MSSIEFTLKPLKKAPRKQNSKKINGTMMNVQNEFWYHVSAQNEIPIAGDISRTLDVKLLLEFLRDFPEEESVFYTYLYGKITEEKKYIDILRTFIGISDKRMYLELSYIFSKTLTDDSEVSICGCSLYNLNRHSLSFFKNLTTNKDKKISNKSKELITTYLVERDIYTILKTLHKLDEQELVSIIDYLVLPKEIQQESAKRRGHGAEFEVAKILNLLGCKVIPHDRHLKPMGTKDPNVDKNTFEIREKEKDVTWSFDMIVLNDDEIPHIFIQGLIHTSDPGQYGVNKSDETLLIKESLNTHNEDHGHNKELWGLVDGVGFSENKKDTINKMLDEFDNFIQLKSLYKIGLRLHNIGFIKLKGIRFNKEFYSSNDIKEMFEKYGNPEIQIIESQEELKIGKEIEAGKAWLYL